MKIIFKDVGEVVFEIEDNVGGLSVCDFKPPGRKYRKAEFMTKKKAGRANKLITWINKKEVGVEFTLDDFYKETGTTRSSNHRYDRLFTSLTDKGCLRRVDSQGLVRFIEKVKVE